MLIVKKIRYIKGPNKCPRCGATVSGSICPKCGATLPVYKMN